MVCVQLELLPQPSVAVNVRRMVYVPVQLPGTTRSLWVTVAPLQSSVAVALPVAVTFVDAVQEIVVLAGQVIDGAGVSCTVMVWVSVEALSQTSVAVNVRVIV